MGSPKIETPKGLGEIEKLYVSELGFLMLKVYYKNGTFITYNLGKHNENDNIFTNQIMEYENNI
jgi:hypothetical protein